MPVIAVRSPWTVATRCHITDDFTTGARTDAPASPTVTRTSRFNKRRPFIFLNNSSVNSEPITVIMVRRIVEKFHIGKL